MFWLGLCGAAAGVAPQGFRRFHDGSLEGCESPGLQPAELGGGYEGRFFLAERGEGCPRQGRSGLLAAEVLQELEAEIR